MSDEGFTRVLSVANAHHVLLDRIESREWWIVISYDARYTLAARELEHKFFRPGTRAARGFEALLLAGDEGFPAVLLFAKDQLPFNDLREWLAAIGAPRDILDHWTGEQDMVWLVEDGTRDLARSKRLIRALDQLRTARSAINN